MAKQTCTETSRILLVMSFTLGLVLYAVFPANSAPEVLRNIAPDGKASSPDGHDPDHGGESAPAAVDGDSSTYWDDENDKDQYRLVVKFDESRTIHALRITGYEHHDFAPKDFQVRLNGKTVKQITGAKYESNTLNVDLPGTDARTVELRITGYYGSSPAVRELQILSPAPGLEALSKLPSEDISLAETVDPDQLSWERDENASIQLNGPDGPIWRFRYSDEFGKPHFDPVRPYGGPSLTWSMPHDHVWHYGLWFSWKYINSVNYWEENKKTLKAKGRTSWSNVEATTLFDGSARITMDLSYHEPGKDPVLTERRIITIGRPRVDGSYEIDWRSVFRTGDQNVTLDRTPPPGVEGGKSWGGYAGLSIRYAKELKKKRLVTTGGIQKMANGKARLRSLAGDMNGEIQGGTAGIAMIDHPSNPRHPSPWYAIANGDFGYLNAAIVQPEPMTLPADETLRLRYRMLVHKNRWNEMRLKKEVGRYLKHWKSSTSARGEQVIRVSDRPRVFRLILPDASTRSMAVGFPNGPHTCFDAEQCVLRYAWSGGFIDRTPQIKGRGGQEVELLGERFSTGNHKTPFRFAGASDTPQVEYEQYRVDGNRVTFRYRVDGLTVRQTVSPTPDGPGLRSRYQLASAPPSDLLLERDREKSSILASDGTWEGNKLRIAAEPATSFTIIIRPNR